MYLGETTALIIVAEEGCKSTAISVTKQCFTCEEMVGETCKKASMARTNLGMFQRGLSEAKNGTVLSCS
jgi:hypothetical protein